MRWIVVPLILFVAFAGLVVWWIEFENSASHRSRLQFATDATALYLAKFPVEERRDKVEAVLDAMLDSRKSARRNVQLQRNDREAFHIITTIEYPTKLLWMVGIPSASAEAETTVK